VSEEVVSVFGCPEHEMEQQQRCSNGGAWSGAWRPRRHNVEHVVCSEVVGVACDFRPLLYGIGSWAQNEVC
jgi:hypothetical protein